MALMVVGFGLRDSIMCIGTIQYQELQVYDGMVYLSNSVTDEEIRTIMNTMDEMGKMDRYMEMEMMKSQLPLQQMERQRMSTFVCRKTKRWSMNL